MAKVSIYLNFNGNCEEAFKSYQKIFNASYSAPFFYMRDMPATPGMPALSEKDKNAVMHVGLNIMGETNILGTDMLESMGHHLIVGNNTTINLELDNKEDADRLYAALSEGSRECAPMSQQFWGYWGCCLDRFGIRWMFNVMNNPSS